MIFLAFHVTSSEIWHPILVEVEVCFLWIAHLSIAWKNQHWVEKKHENPATPK